jgi:hypothetical protein
MVLSARRTVEFFQANSSKFDTLVVQNISGFAQSVIEDEDCEEWPEDSPEMQHAAPEAWDAPSRKRLFKLETGRQMLWHLADTCLVHPISNFTNILLYLLKHEAQLICMRRYFYGKLKSFHLLGNISSLNKPVFY